jgi:uncharacterized membrane protein
MAASKDVQAETDFFSLVGNTFKMIGASWEALKLNLGTFILIAFIPMVIVAISLIGSIAAIVQLNGATQIRDGSFMLAAFILVGIVAACVFLPAITYTQIASAKGKKIGFNDALVNSRKYILRYIGLVILVALSVIVGMVLLIIPGILAAFFFSMSIYTLIDKNTGVIESMKQSYQLVKANWMIILAMLVVNLAVSVVSYVPIIGRLASTALYIAYFCLPALIYLKISKE